MPPGWAPLASEAWVSRGFGDFWQHCLVAEGAVDVAAEPSLQIWDYSAVRLIVEEAGGRCSTFTGGTPAPGASFLATNGALHGDGRCVPRGDRPREVRPADVTPAGATAIPRGTDPVR